MGRDTVTKVCTTLIHPHEVTAGVSSLYMGYSYANLSTVVAPAGLLAQGTAGQMALAWSEVGQGRIVALSDPLLLDGLSSPGGQPAVR